VVMSPFVWQWADWFNLRRLFKPIGNMPTAEKELTYHESLESRTAA